jgi:SAM-dependent methyltransferase
MLDWRDGHAIDKTCKVIAYGRDYWLKYQKYKNTNFSIALNAARLAIVSNYYQDGYILDVGIGNGHFIELCNIAGLDCEGVDVNPYAVEWLRHNDYIITRENYEIVTYWDSFEHIPDLDIELKLYNAKYIIMSIPIFDEATAERSKHYRPGEHLHYFTNGGIIKFMETHNYDLVMKSSIESDLGREDIYNYAFKRS